MRIYIAHVMARREDCQCPFCGDAPEEYYPTQADGTRLSPFDHGWFTCMGCGERYEGTAPEPPECF